MTAAFALQAIALASLREDEAELLADGPAPSADASAGLKAARAIRVQEVAAYKQSLDPAGIQPTPMGVTVCARCGGAWRAHLDRARARLEASRSIRMEDVIRTDCEVQR